MELKPVVPFEPTSTQQYPKGDQWIAQIKWDGTRILTYFDGFQTQLFNRKCNERTLQYAELTKTSNFCNAESVILDGEVIALHKGKPSFHEVMRRDSLRKQEHISRVSGQIPIVYMVFDVLFYNGAWVTGENWEARNSLLEDIIIANESVQFVPSYGDAEQLFNVVKEHDLEGIVCKDRNSQYRLDGKDKRWQKLKWTKDLIAVVGGVTYRSHIVNSLLLGLYDAEGRLWYIGHAGTGKLRQEDWRALTNKIETMKTTVMPFYNTPERSKDSVWIDPSITVKIQYLEWTLNQTLRQPSIQAFVHTPPQDCTFIE
jgi:bifunctional non-homologous end joining protein LigD